MSYLQNIDASYAEHERMANYYAGKDAAQQHAAHLVMQRLIDDRNAYLASLPKASPTGSGPSPGPTPPDPKPANPWITTSSYVGPTGVKQADPDIVIFDSETINPELLIQLEYENISGTELINITRSDIIDGRQIVYSPIKNLSSLRRKYNPNNIISLSSTLESIFSKYLINLIQRGVQEPYFDENGGLVVEIQDVFDDELIEIEIDASGTIDTVEFL
jgi:hypothetical protein